jgi:hypothetical protein
MNIFVTSLCPIESARALDDKRVVKMVLESAQMLSNVMHHLELDAPYKKTHWNHPCSIWSRAHKNNYLWLLQHFKALCEEYTHRYNKSHKCEQYMLKFHRCVNFLPANDNIEFVNCTTNHKHIDKVFEAYKQELNLKWKNDKRAPHWTNRIPPVWRHHE